MKVLIKIISDFAGRTDENDIPLLRGELRHLSLKKLSILHGSKSSTKVFSDLSHGPTVHGVLRWVNSVLAVLCWLVSEWKGKLMHKVVDLCQLVQSKVNYCRFPREKRLQNGVKNWYLCAALIVHRHQVIYHNYQLMCFKLLFFAGGTRVTKQIMQWMGQKNDYLPGVCTNYMNYSGSASLQCSFVSVYNGICTHLPGQLCKPKWINGARKYLNSH